MTLTDPLKSFLIKKLLVPKVFRIDIPGYAIGRFYTPEGQNVFIRNAFFPETFFFYLERMVMDELGPDGVGELYAAAKEFGYVWAQANHLSRLNKESSIKLATDFLEVFYAEQLRASVNVQNKYVELYTKDLFITRISGGGYSLTVGGYAGLCAYVFDDYGIECGVAGQTGDYKLYCGTPEMLKNNNIQHFGRTRMPDSVDAGYIKYNKPPAKQMEAQFNLSKFMQDGMFNYQNGQLRFSISDIRFAPVDILLLHMLRMHIGSNVAYMAARKAFAEVGSNISKQKDPLIFLSELLTALGYGIVSVTKEEGGRSINFTGYPWYLGPESREFAYLKGMIEGFLEGQKDHSKIVDVESRINEDVFLVSVRL
jgi:hypothetical protein